ncbi:MAG: methionine--tRNA ligase subunit beta [Patescibacteria group bacterium]
MSINIDDFQKIDLRIAKILMAERVPDSEKLVRLEVDLGDPSTGSGLGKKQVVAGIAKSYTLEELVGKEIVVVANLEPRTFAIRQAQGELLELKSQGMLLAAHDADGGPILLMPERGAPPGSAVS